MNGMLENFRLRVFREVAQQGSFRRAGELLYITQPAVTQQIKALEAELGHKLLDRAQGQVRLTAAGAMLLQHAQSSEATLRLALEELAMLRGELRGTLRVAASTTIAQYILPKLLASFGSRYPGLTLHLESANTEHVAARVSEGAAALGLVEGPVQRHDLITTPWITDELVLAVPRTHPWAGQEVSPKTLCAAPLLLREPGSGTRAVLEAGLRELGLRADALHVTMQLGSTEALLACIEAGLGVGFVSRFALRRQRKLGTLALARVPGLHVHRTLSLIHPRGPEPEGIAATFTTFLLNFAQRRQRRRMAAASPALAL